MVDLNGKKTDLTERWASAMGAAWSPSGDEIWFTATATGFSRSLRGVTLSGKVRELLERSRNPHSARRRRWRPGFDFAGCHARRGHRPGAGRKQGTRSELAGLDRPDRHLGRRETHAVHRGRRGRRRRICGVYPRYHRALPPFAWARVRPMLFRPTASGLWSCGRTCLRPTSYFFLPVWASSEPVPTGKCDSLCWAVLR